MTSSPPINAAPDGMIISETAEHGLSALRRRESCHLISLACDAVASSAELALEIHTAIHQRDKTPADHLQRQLLEALTCLETADHYLRMLDEVIVPGPDEADCGKPEDTKTGDPWAV